jgi:hypothetical protein
MGKVCTESFFPLAVLLMPKEDEIHIGTVPASKATNVDVLAGHSVGSARN